MLMRSLLLLSLLCLSSCTMMTSVVCKEEKKTPLNLLPPEPLEMESVRFKVVHKDNASSVMSKMEQEGQEPVLFGLTGLDYKNLAINIERLKAYILKQKKIIELQKRYYEGK